MSESSAILLIYVDQSNEFFVVIIVRPILLSERQDRLEGGTEGNTLFNLRIISHTDSFYGLEQLNRVVLGFSFLESWYAGQSRLHLLRSQL